MKWITLFSLLFTIHLSIGQTNWINYTHTHNIVDLVELDEGFWLGSEGGLCYYDKESGTQTYYNQGNSVLPSNKVIDLFYSSDNELWISTVLGLSRWKDGMIENTPFTYGDGFLNETLDGKIIYGKNNGVYIQTEGLEFEELEYGENFAAVGGIEVNQDNGDIYVYINNWFAESQLAVWKDNAWTISNKEYVYDSSMAMDSDNRLWIVNRLGLQYYEDGNWVVVEKDGFEEDIEFPRLYINTKDEVVVFNQTSTPRLWVWDGSGLEEVEYIDESASNFNYFIKPSERQDGLFYGSNLENGFYSFTVDEINDPKLLAQSPLLSNIVQSTLHHPDGSHYVFMAERIQKITSGIWTEIPAPVELDRFIKKGYIDSDGVLWIRDFTNLWKYENETWINIELPSDLSANLDLLEIGDNGDIWIQSDLNLARFKDSEWTIFNTNHHGITLPSIEEMKIEPITGNLWVTTVHGAVYFDGQQWETFVGDGEFNRALKISFGNDGVFILFYKGLKFFKDGELNDIPLPEDEDFIGYDTEMVYHENRKDLYLSKYRILAVLRNDEWTLHQRPEARIYTSPTSHLSIDIDDNLWMSGNGSGICIFNSEGITSLSINNGNTISDDALIAVYPTLISNNRIFIESKESENFMIFISDASGRIIYENAHDIIKGIPREIEIPQIGSQLCFVSVVAKNEIITQKVIRIQN